tara:strand:- start:1869 stop:2111 length:243 start_codon:yes stop_codon:yes gene_type:complete
MDTKSCPQCGATWVDGQHYWTGTGKIGSEVDLAGLVCNTYGDKRCVNPLKGSEIGDTWEKRLVAMRQYGKNVATGEIEDL